MSKKCYTDGKVTKKFEEGTAPEGWVLGCDPIRKESVRLQHEKEKEKMKDPEYREQQRLKKRESIIKRYGSWENYRKIKDEKRKESLIKKYGSLENAYASLQEAYKQTMLEQYGVTSNFYLEETKEKRKKTWEQNYGVDNPNKCSEVREKTKQTNIEKYGHSTAFWSPEIREKIDQDKIKKYGSIEAYNQSMLEKRIQFNQETYGCDHFFQTDEFKDKAQKTLIEKYGSLENARASTSEACKKTMCEKYGSEYYFGSKEFKDNVMTEEKKLQRLNKSNETKYKHNSFNSSKAEKSFYELLLTRFSNDDIIKNYQDCRYTSPKGYKYKCDFYIKSIDTFIELNIHWSHGGQRFNPENPECVKQLQEWAEKAKTSKFYKNSVLNWTKRDVEKYNVALKNKLNYVVVYDINEFNIEVL